MIKFYDRPTKALIELPDEFKLVYQGGLHNVYCNGARHYRSSGGYTQSEPGIMGYGYTDACDCAQWLDKS